MPGVENPVRGDRGPEAQSPRTGEDCGETVVEKRFAAGKVNDFRPCTFHIGKVAADDIDSGFVRCGDAPVLPDSAESAESVAPVGKVVITDNRLHDQDNNKANVSVSASNVIA